MILYLAIYSIIISILIAKHNWHINKNTLLLSGIFIVFSIQSISHHFASESNDPYWVALFYLHFSPLWYLIGPLLFLYTRNTLVDRVNLEWRDLVHAIPALIQFIRIAPYLFCSFDQKLAFASAYISETVAISSLSEAMRHVSTLMIMARTLLILFYCVLCVRLLLSYYPRKHDQLQARMVLTWLIVLVTTVFIISASYFLLTLLIFRRFSTDVSNNQHIAHLFSGIVFILLPNILLLFFPKILFGIPKFSAIKAKKVSAKVVEEDPLAETANVITAYIETEKLYLNPDFDIAEISDRLGIPKHHIVYCFSVILDTRFTSYRSKLRVEYAKTLLKSGITDTLSIDGIGVQSGFPSRSTFYANFKAETGMTPSQYLEGL